MKTKSLTPVMTGIFLVLVFSFLGYQRVHKPRVFVLHSYDKKMPWVERINQGISQVFKDKAYISLRYFYMDTKNRDSKPYLNRISKAALAAIYAWKPDILIACDSDAQNLVNKYFSKSENIKIILTGVTDSRQLPAYEKSKHITAITEEIPVIAVREILSLIFRQQRRIYYLSDDSSTSKTLEKNMLDQNWGSYDLIKHMRVKTFKEWQAAVRDAGKNADILLVSVYNSIKDGKRHVSPAKLVSWMNDNSPIPVVGVYESFILDGGKIAIAISSIEQGYSAAWMAFNLIENKLSMTDIPLMHGKTFSLFIDKNKLQKSFPRAQVPVILDAFSRANKQLNTMPNTVDM